MERVWLIKMVIMGGKTGTSEAMVIKKINTFISIFPSNKPNYTLFVMRKS